MAIPLFNSVASWLLKKRIHQIELFTRYPVETQFEVLQNLVSYARTTSLGKRYDFGSIYDYKQFSERVPVVTYEDIAGVIERTRLGEKNLFWPTPIKWYAKSSGTTNAKSKFIPVSTESLEDCHYKAGKDMLSLYFNNNPDAQLFKGKSLRLGGSQQLYHNNESYYGDLSAIIIDNMPLWAELNSTPSHKVSLMPEWESKMAAIIAESVKDNVTSIAGVPSWMMVLLNALLDAEKKNTVHEIWPNLEVYFHGGVSFVPYRKQYENFFPGDQLNYYEIYNASEGFFAIQDLNQSDELLLMLDYGIFYEFIPLGEGVEAIVPLAAVEKNKDYEMVITTNAGLWRYRIGDVIRFTSLDPYRIKISGRTKHYINVFGEELVIDNAEKALARAAELTCANVVDFTAAPIFMESKTKGGHEWLIEFDLLPNDLDRFTQILDETLKALNSDYEAKRYKDTTMSAPKIHAASKGLFYQWLKSKGKLGGQHKVPRLSNQRELLEELLKMNA